MEIPIEIKTRDRMLIKELFGQRGLSRGETRKQLSPDVALVYDGGILTEAVDWPFIEKIIIMAAQTTNNLVWALVANYLFKFLEGRNVELKIAGKEVPIRKDLIQLTLMESIGSAEVKKD